MGCQLTPEELDLRWSLLPEEQGLLRNKAGIPRLGFAALLKFFQSSCEAISFSKD
jgi:hypothetical protein